MKTRITDMLTYGVLIALLALVALLSNWNHQYSQAELNMVRELALNSRPDPWTGTEDDERTKKLCAALVYISGKRANHDHVIALLPDVCK